jgi:pyruvate dehydrogenase E2 component (dihydrolipoamide acetyltransferase)/2-oxoisovalerate dehydrogenase E2 component (dihydrolipoyl transacylase)
MDFPLPPVGEGLIEVELVRWLVRPGEAVARGQPLAEVMSDKATMEVPAPFAGTVDALAAEAGTKVQVGQVVLTYTPAGGVGKDPSPGPSPRGGGERAPHGLATPSSVSPPPAGEGAGGRGLARTANGHAPPAAPSVRLLARKLGVDLAAVRGTGPGGRVLLDDLTPHLKPRPGDGASRPAEKPAPKPDYGTPGTRVKLVGLRRKIAEHMVAAKRQAPHYSYIDECDLSDLVRLRESLREPFRRNGVKLTYLAFVVKAAARALKEVPVVNSTYDDAANEVVYHDRYNVGVAVATPGGLIVPVVKDADKKDLAAVAADIDRLGADAKAGKVKADDLKGGTFTVTSVGNIGGLISTPIVNHPEVGILGLGKVVRRPVYDDAGLIRPAEMIYLSFSFDHRIVDGAVGAAFGNAVARHLRNPATLLLPDPFGA